jgi:GT2 family glycosyltransferase
MNNPVAIAHLDLSQPEPAIPPAVETLVVFWWKALPLGLRVVGQDELPFGPGQLRAIAVELLAEQLPVREPRLGAPLRATFEGDPKRVLSLDTAEALDQPLAGLDRLAEPSSLSAEAISLIICTRDRVDALALCLQRIREQISPPGEVVVVDNSADGSARAVCAADPAIVYVHEPRPGLSIARNAGLKAASKALIAFTDDDVEPHPRWLAEIALAFTRPEVEAVTGLVLPASLDTLAQRLFQFDMGGFGAKFVPTTFESQFFAEMRPYGAHVWKIGAGANMAFRRSAFDRTGPFDVRLGAGASGCSEDSELWYRLLALGGACLYEPRAVVFHHHRAELPGLKRQMRAYMRGHVSALVAQYDAFRDAGNLKRIGWQLPRYFLAKAAQTAFNRRPERRDILIQEVIGWLQGLQYLLRPAWRRARVERPAP